MLRLFAVIQCHECTCIDVRYSVSYCFLIVDCPITPPADTPQNGLTGFVPLLIKRQPPSGSVHEDPRREHSLLESSSKPYI